MKKLISKILLAGSFGLGCVAAASGNPHRDSGWEYQGEFLTAQADEFRDVLGDQFRRSGVYAELRRNAAQLERTSRTITGLAKNRNGLSRVGEEIQTAHYLIENLEALVDQARFRANRGLDRPIVGCTLHVDTRLAAMRHTLMLVRAEVTALTSCARPVFPGGGFYDSGGWAPTHPAPWNHRPATQGPQYNPGIAPSYHPGAHHSGGVSDRRFDSRHNGGVRLTSDGIVFRVGGIPVTIGR